MPTYSYRCANCGHEFDQYQSFTDDALTVCPVCGEPQLRKVFNSIGVSFTGSGFYRNDSRAADKSSGSGSSSGSESKSSDAAATPKADKPAAASTPAPTPAAKPASGTGSAGSGSSGSAS